MKSLFFGSLIACFFISQQVQSQPHQPLCMVREQFLTILPQILSSTTRKADVLVALETQMVVYEEWFSTSTWVRTVTNKIINTTCIISVGSRV